MPEEPVLPPDAWQGGLWDYLPILRRRSRTILLVSTTVIGLAVLHIHATPKTYRATARLQVLRSQPAQPLAGQTSEAGTSGELSLSTLVRIARSSRVAQRASRAIGRVQQPPISAQEIVKSLKVSVEEPDVLAISAEGQDAVRAATIANAVMDTFVEENRDVGQAGISAARHFLDQQLPNVLADLRRAEADVKRFRERFGVREADATAELKTRVAYDFGAEADRARADVDAAVSELASLERRLAEQSPTRSIQRVVTDPVAEGFKAQLARVEVALATARARYDDPHPRVLALQEELAQLRRLQAQRNGGRGASLILERAEEADPVYDALRERVRDQRSRVAALKARARALSVVVAKHQAELPASPKAYVELARLEHIREGAERAYLNLLDRLQTARMDEVRLLGASRVIDQATAPEEPVRPKPAYELLLAAMVSLLAGFTFALVQQRLDTTIRGPEDVAWHTGMQTVGALPLLRGRGMDTKIAASAPRSPMAEAIRKIQAHLMSGVPPDKPAVLLVTSADVHEGKSFVATNLAIVLAQMRIRTVIVEMDLHRTRVHRTFRVLPSPGVSDILSGTAQVSEALRETEIPDLRVLPRGSRSPNPGALFGPSGLVSLVTELRTLAEVVVIDTPPVLALADATRLAPYADATLLVVEQGRTRAPELIEVRRTVERLGGAEPYVVLNKVRGGQECCYRRYRAYYSDERNDAKPEPGSADTSATPPSDARVADTQAPPCREPERQRRWARLFRRSRAKPS